MLEKAIVEKKIRDHVYQVQLQKDSAQCAGCGFEKGCCQGSSILSVQSKRELTIGEEVEVEVEEKNEFFRVFLVFLMPLVVSIISAILSFQVIFPGKNLFAFLFFIGVLFVCFIIIHFFEKKSKRFLPYVIDSSNEQ